MATVDLGIGGLEDAVQIGRGGFGSVYRARQVTLSRTVAVKVMRDTVTDERVRRRFERECWAMGTLASHPHIITVHGSGFTERGQPYLLMEYTPNGALADRLNATGPLPWAEVLAIGVRVAGALETAHRSGVLHRDVKPENILVSTYGEPQLADFGIARLQGGEETKTDTLTASIAHVSPELLGGEAPSARSDVYALGSTLYMLLAGAPAFIHDTDQSIVPALIRITSEPPPDLRSRGVPAALCEVVEAMMAKDLSARTPTAEAAGRALQECQDRLGQPVTPLTIIGEPQLIIDLTDATATIRPEELAAYPGLDAQTARGIAAHAALAAGAQVTPPETAGSPPAATRAAEGPDAPPPSPTPASGSVVPGRPRPVALGVVVLVLLGAMGGAVLLWTTADDANPAGEVDGAALLEARLQRSDLPGSWLVDDALERRAAQQTPALVCGQNDLATTPVHAVAYHSAEGLGPRAAHALREFPAGDAAAFMSALRTQLACADRQPNWTEVAVEDLQLGDEAVRLAYVQVGQDIQQDVVVVFQRVGDVVSQVIHLDYPSADEALTDELIDVTDRKLADLAA